MPCVPEYIGKIKVRRRYIHVGAQGPYEDFDINPSGTVNLLETARRNCPDWPFVYLSTNKVYGNAPNELNLDERDSRWDCAGEVYYDGLTEKFNIDQSKHSLFGASTSAADIYVQEYGRYFNMPACCMRGECLSSPNHSGVEVHGFLSYIIKCNIEGKEYNIYGHMGKQVRDNSHSYDVVEFIEAFITAPKSVQVYY